MNKYILASTCTVLFLKLTLYGTTPQRKMILSTNERPYIFVYWE
jgi:hypothetical protein